MNAPRVTTRVTAGLALVTALALVGCKHQSSSDAPAKPASAPTAASKAPAAPPAAKPGPAPAAAPAAAAPAAAGGAPSIDQLSSERRVRQEQVQVLIGHLRGLADQAFSDSRFDDARKFYNDILDLEPRDEGAKRRLAQIGALLGDAQQGARRAFDDAVDSWSVRVQQAKVEISNLVAQAKAKEEAGDYDGAVDVYDRALVILRLYPSTVDFTPSEAGLAKLRARAKDTAAAAREARRARTVKEAGERTRMEAAAQRAARQTRLETLLRNANKAMDAQNYQQALNLSEEILRDDPENRGARRLRDLSLSALNDALDEEGKARIIQEWKYTFEQLAEAATPQTQDYRFPKSWGEIQGRRTPPVLSNASAATENPKDREVRNKLEATRTSIQFENVTLENAIAYLTRVTGVNIIILPKAKEGKSDEELTINNLKFEQPLPVSKVLDIVTKIPNLAWNVENGVVQITTPEEARGVFVVQLYDVKDIATPISQFPGSEINLDPTGELTRAEEPPEAVAEYLLDQIIELVTGNVDKTVWESGGEVTGLQPGTLVVKAPRETQRNVQQLLSGLRGAGGLQVAIETRFVTVTDNFLEEVGVDLRGLGDQSGGVGIAGKGGLPGAAGTTIPVTFDDLFFGSAGAPGGLGTDATTGIFYNMNSDGDIRARFENLFEATGIGAFGKAGVMTPLGGFSFQGTLIDDTQLEVILRAVQKSDRSTLVLAPRLTAYAGQRANITVLNQVSYISDFDVEIAQAAQIGDPIVQTLRDGVVLDIKPIVTADRRFITMELRPTIALLTRPIATFLTTLAQGPPVTIQLPELQIQRVRTTVTMPDGGTLLLGGLKYFEEKRLESGVPWFNKVPVLNFVLSRKGTYEERRNLLVLIRASIVRPEENEPLSAR